MRQEAAQPALAFEERKIAQVFTIHPQQVKRVEHRLLPPEHEVVEMRLSIGTDADDLAVDHCVMRLDRVGELLATGAASA